jgi:hypothetical protein
MNDASSILVLSACTATKTPSGDCRLTAAEDLYAGQQHRRLMRGVRLYRAAGEPAGHLELQIVSAQHGVIPGHEAVRSYDATFSGLPTERLLRRAARLGVPTAVAELLAAPRRLAILLLGDPYLRASRLLQTTELGAPTLVFASPKSAGRLPSLGNLYPVMLDNDDARRFSCGLVGLKGELAARLLARFVDKPGKNPPLDDQALLASLEDINGRAVRALVEHVPSAA